MLLGLTRFSFVVLSLVYVFVCCRSTVYDTLKRYDETSTHEARPKSGRPRLSTEREDRVLVRNSLNNRKLSIPQLRQAWQTSGIAASKSTVRRRLQSVGLGGHVAAKKPLLTAQHRQKRLLLTMLIGHGWTGQVFYRQMRADLPCSRMMTECLSVDDNMSVFTRTVGGGGIMMWGAMSYRVTGILKKVSRILDAKGYIKILEDAAVPSAHLLGYGDLFWYQDDGAPCHRAKIVSAWKEENGFRCHQGPPQSPDLNPIETLWGDIKRALRSCRSRNFGELEANVMAAWRDIPATRSQELLRQMPARIKDVISAKGGHTKW